MIGVIYAAELADDRRRELFANAWAYRFARLARGLPLGSRRARQARPGSPATVAAGRMSPYPA
jgi:hypothetical protein